MSDRIDRAKLLVELDRLQADSWNHDEGDAWADGVGWAMMKVEQAEAVADE